MEFHYKVGPVALVIIALLATGYLVILVSTIDDLPAAFSASTGRTPMSLRQSQGLITEKSENQLQLQLSAANAKIVELQSSVEKYSKERTEMVVAPEVISSSSPLAHRPGVIILGMHRSGTSIIGGLVNKMGLKTGGPLIQAAEDNKKGFFERIDVVLQNDALMAKQNAHYSHNTHKYDSLIGVKHVLNDDGSFFKEGKRGLAFLNDVNNYPWMLKDPRLCITIRTWLPLLNFVPAILFTYRHPLDVALSMHKREFEQFPIAKGLKLWYVYNRRAVEQSQDLCRVVGSHRKIMASPSEEFDRIFRELVACGVPVPRRLSNEDISEFVDKRLQHGKTGDEASCGGESSWKELRPPESSWPSPSDADLKLYRESMRVFCAFEDRSAFTPGFRWDLTVLNN